MKRIKWGILATGYIAAKLAEALHLVPDAELLAVASRTKNSAEEFGDQWNIPRRYDSYQTMANDPDIDIIYIATPHTLHYENMLMCLNAGKHVLCEKPLTINAREAEECINLAKEKNLFLMEAIWMRFFPAIKKVMSLVKERHIGDVRLIQADFCFHLPFDAKHRLYDPALGGGSLLDIGIYPLSFTSMLQGFPQEIYGQAQVGETNVDELNSITLVYEDNVIAQLSSSFVINKPKEAFIVGTKGYIKVHEIFFCPDKLTIHLNGQNPETLSIPFKGNGYPHEIEEVHSCLKAGKNESDLLPLGESLRMMKLMDGLRAQWGVQYAADKSN